MSMLIFSTESQCLSIGRVSQGHGQMFTSLMILHSSTARKLSHPKYCPYPTWEGQQYLFVVAGVVLHDRWPLSPWGFATP